MKLYFVTGNKHKFNEVKRISEKFNIDLEQFKGKKLEPKDLSVKEVAELNAKKFYKELKQPIIVDDTGIFFEAYPKFPGNHPKLMYNLLGFKGLLKLLEN